MSKPIYWLKVEGAFDPPHAFRRSWGRFMHDEGRCWCTNWEVQMIPGGLRGSEDGAYARAIAEPPEEMPEHGTVYGEPVTPQAAIEDLQEREVEKASRNKEG